MKCSNDQSEMEEGLLTQGYWVKGNFEKQSFFKKPIVSMTTNSQYVTAWKCPICGKVELKVENKK